MSRAEQPWGLKAWDGGLGVREGLKVRKGRMPGRIKSPVGPNPGMGECRVGSNPRVGSNVQGVKKVRGSAKWRGLMMPWSKATHTQIGKETYFNHHHAYVQAGICQDISTKKEQGAMSKEQRAKSSEQRTRSKEQWAKNKEQGARSNEQRTVSRKQGAVSKEQWALLAVGNGAFWLVEIVWAPKFKIQMDQSEASICVTS